MKYSLDETAMARRNNYACFEHTVYKHVYGFGLRKGGVTFFSHL